MAGKRQIMFISHGGGPLPLLGDPAHEQMVATLRKMASQAQRPSAILVISAHWEAPQVTITSGAHPDLLYDYGGFPRESYEIQYPSPGEPKLAERIEAVLAGNNIPVRLDDRRGFDHGVFVPLKLMYPDADIPVVQLSLLHSLNAEQHVAIGEALADLQWDDLLVVGSGFSFHNMRAFFTPDQPELTAKNLEFEHWLRAVVANEELPESDRREQLVNWVQAPSARFCHPREEHLLPLHVCYGMAGKASSETYVTTILNRESSMFFWA